MQARLNSARCWRPLGYGQAAFTIIELVVVLVLIGIVSTAVAPAVWHATTLDAGSTLTAPVVSLLRFAQRTATQQNETVSVIVDPGTNYYRVQTVPDGLTRTEGTLAFPAPTRFITNLARLQVVFDPARGVDGDSLVVTDEQSVAVVRIDPWTGAIGATQQ